MQRTNPKAQDLYLKRRRLAMAVAANIGECLYLQHLTGVDLITIDLGKLAADVLLDSDPEVPANLKWSCQLGDHLRKDLMARMDEKRRRRDAPTADNCIDAP